MIEKTDCPISTVTDTQIECTLAEHSAGTYSVMVQLDNIGYSDSNKMFSYDIVVDSLSSSEGYLKIPNK